MEATFIDTEHSLTESDIVATEQQLNIQIPNELKVHYLKFNGGSPEPYCFFTADKCWLVVQEFLAMRYGANTVEYTYQTLTTTKNAIPKYMIPFAVEARGNYFLLSIETAGGVFYYDVEHFDNPRRAYTKLTNTLTEFIDQLQEEPDEF